MHKENIHFEGKLRKCEKTKKLPYGNKIALELLHQRLGHRPNRSLLAGDTANICEDIELIIDPDPFCTSCQIYSMNNKTGSKIPLNPKVTFKWIFMEIVPSTSPKHLTSGITFYNYILSVDAYSEIPKRYIMEKIPTEEVMDKLDMFQCRFGKLDEFGWWDLERISTDTGTHLTLRDLK